MMDGPSRCLALIAVQVALLVGPGQGNAQERPSLRIERADGELHQVDLRRERGYSSVELSVLTGLGWTAAQEGGRVSLAIAQRVSLVLNVGSPFILWDERPLQLTDPPYVDGGKVHVPVQLLIDFFPAELPELYEFDAASGTLRAGEVDAAPRGAGVLPTPSRAVERDVEERIAAERGVIEGPRVVIIDAGHGGADPGALGPDGIREKEVALGVSRRLAEILRRVPWIEVRMTREEDTFVDLWLRGEQATEIKGERPGIFVSIHANSFPNRRSARGFETYFLSEARTEHERRVAAIENAPLSVRGEAVDPVDEADLSFILRELRNLDHQHWSALLAEMVQDELATFHPGPNRGVKQGVLAVLTNALMPSVLVEVGYLSNEEEGRLLAQSSFQERAAEALADAILRFFERYPPGSEGVVRAEP